jgi:hypothetical protein
MMYQVVEENSLQHFKSRIDLKQDYKNYVCCLGSYHKILSFRLADDGQIELLYKHKISDDTFKISVKFARVSFSLIIDKNNRFYREHASYFKRNEKVDDYVVRKNIQIIGITVGDLIKYFYYNNKDKTEIDFTEDKKENEKFNKLVKKVITVDTTGADVNNVFGTYSSRSQIYTWDTLKAGGYVTEGKNDFTGFCNKILYFDGWTIPSMILRDEKTKTASINHNRCVEIFDNLAGKYAVYKLLRYHLYGDSPEEGFKTQIYYFENPTPIPEILKYFHEKSGDDDYLKASQMIMRKLNANQQKQLEERYKPCTFATMEKIPEEYPAFALRNVSLKQWCPKDLWEIDSHHRDYMRSVKNKRYKYKSEKSNKVIPMDQRFYYRCSCCRDRKDLDARDRLRDEREHIMEAVDDYEMYEDEYDDTYDEYY